MDNPYPYLLVGLGLHLLPIGSEPFPIVMHFVDTLLEIFAQALEDSIRFCGLFLLLVAVLI